MNTFDIAARDTSEPEVLIGRMLEGGSFWLADGSDEDTPAMVRRVAELYGVLSRVPQSKVREIDVP